MINISAANSFLNLNPRKISFRMGGLIAGCMGILIMPWKLLDMYLTWLITYSGLLGAVGGVILCDYVFIRKGNLHLEDLYQEKGEYAYKNGLNCKALIALIAGILVALMGKVFAGLEFLFNGAWFSAAIVSFLVYYFLMRDYTVRASE